jgi:hypothetical protein
VALLGREPLERRPARPPRALGAGRGI